MGFRYFTEGKIRKSILGAAMLSNKFIMSGATKRLGVLLALQITILIKVQEMQLNGLLWVRHSPRLHILNGLGSHCSVEA